WVRRPVPVYAAASGPQALRVAGAAADGAFVNYGLGAEEGGHARRLIEAGGGGGGSSPAGVGGGALACPDLGGRGDTALWKRGNILGFVAAYILGPDPEGRGVPVELVPAVRELRASYTTRLREMDPNLVKRLGLFDYLRARLAVAGTPEDCLEQVRRAEEAGA